MNSKSISLVVLFIVSIASVGIIVAKRKGPQQTQGFTLTETQRFYPANGSAPILVSTTTRYQRSDGSWRKETNCNGKMSLGFSVPGRGVFDVDEKNERLHFVGAAMTPLTEDRLRKDPQFVREETLFGWKTFVIESTALETGEWNEFYMCPALQGYPLKRVTKNKTGSSVVFEVNQVTLGEPPETLFTSMPAFEVSYDRNKQQP